MANPASELPAGPERRMHSAAGLRIETRAAAEEGQPARRQIVGSAVVFDQETTIYEGRYFSFREVIRPGAFTNALKEKQDVRALFNHDPNFVLGRTRSGTLELTQTDTSLDYSIDAPDTQTVRDMVETPIERGDVSGSSFAFTPRLADKITRTENADGTVIIDRGGDRISERIEGERTIQLREVLDANIFDVSPVTYPAYKGTDVSLRAAELPAEFRALIEEKDKPARRSAPVREQFRQYLEAAAKTA